MNLLKDKRFLLVISTSILATIGIFIYHFGWGVLHPTNYGWMLKVDSDWTEHFLGWHFFRSEPWTFPIGVIRNYYFPLGTSVAYTDSIPLLAIPFKLINFLLPEYFQYFGLWFFLNYILQAYFAFRLFEKIELSLLNRTLITLFFVFSPLLTFKTMHPALCAHWLLLGTIWAYFIIDDVKRSLVWQFALLILSALIHPYLCILIIGFTMALIVKWFLLKRIPLGKTFLLLASVPSSVFILWYFIGYFIVKVGKDMGSGGYNWFSLNLNGLFNSNGFALYGPNLPLLFGQQYEAFVYLGLGLIILTLVSITLWFVAIFRKEKFQSFFSFMSKKYLPFILVAFVLTLIAITNIVTFNSKVLFSFTLPSSLEIVLAPFRASARLFWPVYYLFFFVVLFRLSQKIKNQYVLSILLGLSLVIQIADVQPVFTPWNTPVQEYALPLNKPEWEKVLAKSDKILLYPPLGRNVVDKSDDYQYFAVLAAEHSIPVNAGYVSRANNDDIENYTKEMEGKLNEGVMDDNAVYVTADTNIARFKYVLKKELAVCEKIDNYFVILSNKHPFHPETKVSYEQTRIAYFESAIIKSEEWLNHVTEKATQQNIPLDQMINMDAIYMVNEEKKSGQ